MKKCLLLLGFLFFIFIGHSQTYSYSFEGELTIEQITALELKCREISTIQSCKIYYKEGYGKGEIILQVKRPLPIEEEVKNEEQFNPVAVKTLLLEAQLTPLQYRKLND